MVLRPVPVQINNKSPSISSGKINLPRGPLISSSSPTHWHLSKRCSVILPPSNFTISSSKDSYSRIIGCY